MYCTLLHVLYFTTCIVLYYMYNTTPSAGLPLQVMQLVCPIYCSMLHSEILQINRLPLQVL